jgi:site-specific recombinase
MNTEKEDPSRFMASTRELILQLFPEEHRGNRSLRELAAQMERLTNATSLSSRLDAVVQLAAFNRRKDREIPSPLKSANGAALVHDERWKREAVWLSILEDSPEVRTRFHDSLAALLAETNGVSLFAESGLPSDRGLLAELSNRALGILLPAPHDYHELARLFVRMYPTGEEVEHFFSQPPENFERVVALAAPDERAEQWRPMVESLVDAFCLLGARVQGLGLSEKLRVRSKPRPVQQSPFYRLTRAGDAFIVALRNREEVLPGERAWRTTVKGCREELKIIVENMDKRGVNLDVVYALDVIEQSLGRLEAIVTVLVAHPGHEKRVAAQRLLGEVIRGRLADRSVMVLLSNSTKLMSKKIVEWAGKTGEHYIANNRAEYWLMWRAALGGGLLTVGTAAIKMMVTHAGFRPFVEGFLAGLNYAVSFVLLQALGLALATKQPSMTGAALAQIVLRCQENANDDELVTFVARIFRTQLAAALGNIFAVGVGAIGLGFLWHLLFGAPLLEHETAEYALTSLNPLASGTIFYAALTGVILWLSSLVGGWIENWAVYHRLPEAIAEHRLGVFVKPDRLQRVSQYFSRNISGWGGSIALGYMLGMLPPLGRFFGLPLDVRHVTLSTGTVALGAVSLSRDTIPDGALLWAAAGIAVTFVLNLSVSFYLALRLALRAHGVNLGGNITMVRTIFRAFLKSPGEFFFPPADDPAETPVSH